MTEIKKSDIFAIVNYLNAKGIAPRFGNLLSVDLTDFAGSNAFCDILNFFSYT